MSITPSEQCKVAGLKSLAELVLFSDESKQTLINWHKNKRTVFIMTLVGCSVYKNGFLTSGASELINEMGGNTPPQK